MAKGKSPLTAWPGVPYWHPLTAHAAIHGAAVAVLTGVWWLAVAEGVVHWVTDYVKCRGWIGYTTDQLVHVLCKVAWVGVVVALAG